MYDNLVAVVVVVAETPLLESFGNVDGNRNKNVIN